MILIGKLFYFFLPAGVANMSPVLMRKRWQKLARPIDGNRHWRGQHIFGAHKTWRGLVAATIFGGLFWLLEYWLAAEFPVTLSWAPFNLRIFPWWFGFLFGAGAIGGDLVKSFLKRRFTVGPGVSWVPFDQIDFVIGAALVASFFVNFTWQMWIIIFVVTPGFHILVNHLGYWLKIKESAW